MFFCHLSLTFYRFVSKYLSSFGSKMNGNKPRDKSFKFLLFLVYLMNHIYQIKLFIYFLQNIENDFKADLLATVEQGHDSFIKALRNRHKNIQIVRTMWVNGNVKSALDAAVNMDDTSLMGDILAQINQSP